MRVVKIVVGFWVLLGLLTCKKSQILEEVNLQQSKISQDEILWYKSISQQEIVNIPTVKLSSGIPAFDDCLDLTKVINALMIADSAFEQIYFDRGKTDYLLSMILKATKADELALKELLISHSPLSDTVLSTVYRKREIFSEPTLAAIFSINVPLPEKVLDLILEDKNFSQEFKNTVLYSQTMEREPVLETFEYINGISSLRKALVQMESKYLISGSEPDRIPEFFLEDDYLLSVMNNNAELKVGSTIYKFLNERYIAWIPDGDMSALRSLRSVMEKYKDNEIGTFMFTIPENFNHLKFLGDVASASSKIVVTDLRSDWGGLCQARFNYLEDPASPGKVQFINMSRVPLFTSGQGTPVSFFWDFGDGITSRDPSPVHTYANAGTYNVTLVMTYAGGPCGEVTCTDTFSMRVSISASCYANFSVDAPTGQSYVVLTDYSTTNCPGGISMWIVNWGDGHIDTFYHQPSRETHSYQLDNNYRISVQIVDACGCFDVAFQDITINTCCIPYIRTSSKSTYGKYRVKSVLAHRGSLGTLSYTVAKTKFMKRRLGVYFSTRADIIAVSMNGNVWMDGSSLCSNQININQTKLKLGKSKAKTIKRYQSEDKVHVKYQSLTSSHIVSNSSISHTNNLKLHNRPGC